MASDSKVDAETQEILRERIPSIRIFSYPKIIFIWPTMVAAFICGIGMLLVGDLLTVRDYEKIYKEPRLAAIKTTNAAQGQAAGETQTQGDAKPAGDATPEGVEKTEGAAAKVEEAVTPVVTNYFTSWQNMLGLIFLLVFAANLIVMSLDFPRFTIVAAFLLITTVTFLLLYLANQGVPILRPLVFLSHHIYAVANAGFYFTIGFMILTMLLVIAATRYLDYWEVSPNEILHHHGPLSDLERFPTINLKFSKEIPDILEYLLGLGSGRLTLTFGLDNRIIVLEHVLYISKKEVALKQMMGQMSVRIDEK